MKAAATTTTATTTAAAASKSLKNHYMLCQAMLCSLALSLSVCVSFINVCKYVCYMLLVLFGFVILYSENLPFENYVSKLS